MFLPLIYIFGAFMSTLPERILDWTETYCESLTENYKQHSISMHQNFTSEWSKDQLESIKNGTANLTNFVIKNGRKYYKIMQREFDTFQDRNEWREGSVHAFVDKNTGEVYKPASYNAPHTKHVRYNLLDEDSRVECLHRADWAGGYLYLR